MRFCSGCVTWGLIVFYFASVLGFGLLLSTAYYSSTSFDQWGPSFIANISPNWQWFLMWICWIAAGVSFILFCFLFRKIELAIAVLKVTE